MRTTADKAFDLIEANIVFADFIGEMPESLISAAEQALGVSFPPTYRQFLKKYGCGDILGAEFYGLVGNNIFAAGVPNAVWITTDLRKISGMPPSLVVIYAAGYGPYFAIDCNQKDSSGECPVVQWIPGLSKSSDTLEIVADSFGDFIFQTLEDLAPS